MIKRIIALLLVIWFIAGYVMLFTVNNNKVDYSKMRLNHITSERLELVYGIK